MVAFDRGGYIDPDENFQTRRLLTVSKPARIGAAAALVLIPIRLLRDEPLNCSDRGPCAIAIGSDIHSSEHVACVNDKPYGTRSPSLFPQPRQ